MNINPACAVPCKDETFTYLTAFMKMPELQSVLTGLLSMIKMSLSSIRDTFTSHSHSRDFAYARGDYLRNRVVIVGLVFLALLPFWALVDWLMLPAGSLGAALVSRGVMLVALVLIIVLAYYSKARLQLARLSAGLILVTPAAFYAVVLFSVSDETTSLIGYNFIPYMLVAMLAIFPFTLSESAILGGGLILLEAYALHIAGVLFTAEGLQAIWLLAALLSISITANYFQLGLMLRLYREATHDPLTSLLNRGALARTMEQLTTREPDAPRALLMMDLDHFKRINDNHGHAFGDDVLRNFASILRRSLRPNDLAARYGGEEFVAVLVNTDKAAAMAIAENIRAQTEASSINNYDGETINYTVSIGVASFQPGEHFEGAAMRADNRLYEAKKISRNCVVGV